MKILKKDGTIEDFDRNKIINAVKKSAERSMSDFTEYDKVAEYVYNYYKDSDCVTVNGIHDAVIQCLNVLNKEVAQCYSDYRNYKSDFVHMMDETYKASQSIRYIGDKENSNTDSALVATKRCLIYNELNKRFYRKFFMRPDELQACKDGYIYIHDQSARLDTINCCLFDVGAVMRDGFEMGNVWYNEPKTLDTAFDVMGDIILATASQQYGGFTVPEVDKILSYYAEKSYRKYLTEFENYGIKDADKIAIDKVKRDFEQGFQGIEMKLNTVGSSRGDYPFITMSFGLGVTRFARMASLVFLHVHAQGQGKKDHKKPVLFPKLVFLYDKKLHGKGCINYDIFEAGIECSSKTMYPDWLSLDKDEMYQKYGTPVSPMGCRAFLSPWYKKGGMTPADGTDKPVFTGRFNMGVVSLHLPMILAKARKENKDFYEVLDYYLEMIRRIHKRTIEYLGEMKASTNPIGFCEGGFYGGHLKPNGKIKPVLKAMTISYGITALNELQELYNSKSLVQDGEFALEVMEHINRKIEQYKHEDGILYAIYGTPAESLCFTGDTVVQVYNGNKQIKDVKVGDLVYSYNEHTKKIELNKVVKTMKSNKPVLKVNFDNGQSVICTLSHPFAVRKMKKDKMGKITGEYIEYIPALNLKKGNRIKSNYITVNTHGRSECTGGLIQDINAEYAYGKKPNGYVVHHINKNKLDNRFENLAYIKDSEHRKLHVEDTIKNYCFKSDDVTGEKNTLWYYSDDLEKNHRVLSVELLDRVDTVYNIEVENNHNYYVGGDAGVLVHNCGKQVEQFRKIYGIVENVSDKPYVSNSFHCHVTEQISPIEKQDLESRFWHLFKGGRIQYVRYPISYNIEAIKSLVLRAMDKGFYEGVNLSLAYCDDCGHQQLEMNVCPKCGSKNITKIDRMNGYLSYSRVKGDTRLNSAKMAEIADRKSM